MKLHGYKVVFKTGYPAGQAQEIFERYIDAALEELGISEKGISYVCGMDEEEIKAVVDEFKDNK